MEQKRSFFFDAYCIPANHFLKLSWALGTIFGDFLEFSRTGGSAMELLALDSHLYKHNILRTCSAMLVKRNRPNPHARAGVRVWLAFGRLIIILCLNIDCACVIA